MIISLENVKGFTNEAGKKIYELVGIPSMGIETYSLAKIIVPAGLENLPEINQYTELIIPIEGAATVYLDGEIENIQPGKCCIIPPHTKFIITNSEITDFAYWAICIPAFKPEYSRFVEK